MASLRQGRAGHFLGDSSNLACKIEAPQLVASCVLEAAQTCMGQPIFKLHGRGCCMFSCNYLLTMTSNILNITSAEDYNKVVEEASSVRIASIAICCPGYHEVLEVTAINICFREPGGRLLLGVLEPALQAP